MLTDALWETVYARALEAIAQGATRDETRGWLFDRFPSLDPADLPQILGEAYDDALAQGIERDDIDESWHTR
jgi:hypothetical protein